MFRGLQELNIVFKLGGVSDQNNQKKEKIDDVSESTNSVSKVKESARVPKKVVIRDEYNTSSFLTNQCQIQ